MKKIILSLEFIVGFFITAFVVIRTNLKQGISYTL